MLQISVLNFTQSQGVMEGWYEHVHRLLHEWSIGECTAIGQCQQCFLSHWNYSVCLILPLMQFFWVQKYSKVKYYM